MFQAWNQVQVTNQESQHLGQAGLVIRSEVGADGASLAYVRLDVLPDEVVAFSTAELRLL